MADFNRTIELSPNSAKPYVDLGFGSASYSNWRNRCGDNASEKGIQPRSVEFRRNKFSDNEFAFQKIAGFHRLESDKCQSLRSPGFTAACTRAKGRSKRGLHQVCGTESGTPIRDRASGEYHVLKARHVCRLTSCPQKKSAVIPHHLQCGHLGGQY